jgi:hypothetical protein
MVMGGLTDLFTIAVAARKVDNGVSTYYVSLRVTGLHQFIKRLLLLLCKDQDSVWDELLKVSTEEVSSESEEEEVFDNNWEHREGNADRDDTSEREPPKGKENVSIDVQTTSLSLAKEAAVSLNKLKEIERLEEYNEAVSRLLYWDNSRKGLASLTSDILNKMNSKS